MRGAGRLICGPKRAAGGPGQVLITPAKYQTRLMTHLTYSSFYDICAEMDPCAQSWSRGWCLQPPANCLWRLRSAAPHSACWAHTQRRLRGCARRQPRARSTPPLAHRLCSLPSTPTQVGHSACSLGADAPLTSSSGLAKSIRQQ